MIYYGGTYLGFQFSPSQILGLIIVQETLIYIERDEIEISRNGLILHLSIYLKICFIKKSKTQLIQHERLF